MAKVCVIGSLRYEEDMKDNVRKKKIVILSE